MFQRVDVLAKVCARLPCAQSYFFWAAFSHDFEANMVCYGTYGFMTDDRQETGRREREAWGVQQVQKKEIKRQRVLYRRRKFYRRKSTAKA